MSVLCNIAEAPARDPRRSRSQEARKRCPGLRASPGSVCYRQFPFAYAGVNTQKG
jgi:hypothetical protein